MSELTIGVHHLMHCVKCLRVKFTGEVHLIVILEGKGPPSQGTPKVVQVLQRTNPHTVPYPLSSNPMGCLSHCCAYW